jgi:hypothetical protein
MGPCEYGKRHSGATRGGEFLKKFNDYLLFKKDFVPFNEKLLSSLFSSRKCILYIGHEHHNNLMLEQRESWSASYIYRW